MTFPDPVKGRAVWTAAELAADSTWIHILRHPECAEVFEATKAVMAQELDPEGFDRSDFPLPGLASLLDGLAKELHEGRGCILIRDLPIDEVTDHRVPVFSEWEGWLSCGFNPKICINGEAKRGTPVSAEEIATLEYVSKVAARPELSHEMILQAGDIQIVNNHTVLHSRSAFTDVKDPLKRQKLFRLWLNPHLQRSLEREFADRYNTGPNCGVAVGDAAKYVF